MITIPRNAPPPPPVTAGALADWFGDALPDDWFAGPARIVHDDDEIVVCGDLGPPSADRTAEECIGAFREATRDERMAIADAAQTRYRRTVSWGADCGDLTARFTHLSIPAMTRLRIEERQVLDTLVDAGVARSRSDALAWCVRLVARHEADWIAELREAAEAIREVRERGPGSTDPA